MSGILALDLATRLGWAAEVNGCRESGFVDFKVKKGETPGWRFIRFHHWLYKWAPMNLDLIVYEKPIPFHAGQAASAVAFGLSTRVEEFAARHMIRCECVPPTVLKKWATGQGNADKAMMVKMGKQVFKSDLVDDNECDALWLLDYAKAKLVDKRRTA